MKTFVIVPVRNQWHLTERFLESVRDQPVDDVLVLDNGSDDDTLVNIKSMRRRRENEWWLSRLHAHTQPNRSIYEMWNHGFKWARKKAAAPGTDGPWNILVSNNDVILHPRTIHELVGALADHHNWCAYPDYSAEWRIDVPANFSTRATRGVFGTGGMSGSCFMLAGERIPWDPLITDLSYRHWYGDNHLAECIWQKGGRQVRVVGLPILHDIEGTARHHPELNQVKLADRNAWLTRETRGMSPVDRRTERTPIRRGG